MPGKLRNSGAAALQFVWNVEHTIHNTLHTTHYTLHATYVFLNKNSILCGYMF